MKLNLPILSIPGVNRSPQSAHAVRTRTTLAIIAIFHRLSIMIYNPV
jgi:hypothetical protein